MSEKSESAIKPPTVKVVLDTNVLFADEEARLVSAAAEHAVQTFGKETGLDIEWCLPEIVEQERFEQMHKKAVGLLTPVRRLEKLLGHNLALTEEVLADRVRAAIEKHKTALKLKSIGLDYSKVAWAQIIEASIKRTPPFSKDKSEKGFKDALILETFWQLISDSPKTIQRCRLFLVSNDELLKEAAQSRINGAANAAVVTSLEDLRSQLTAIGAHISQADIDKILPQAALLFFNRADRTGLYFKDELHNKILTDPDVDKHPDERFQIKERKLFIGRPTFIGKQAQTLTFSTEVTVRMSAERQVFETHNALRTISNETVGIQLGLLGTLLSPSTPQSMLDPVISTSPHHYNALSGISTTTEPQTVLRQTGEAEFDVTWSAVLSVKGKLSKARVLDWSVSSCDWTEA